MRSIVQKKMESCSILSGYDGLESLKEYSSLNPGEAGEIAWEIITGKGDPGRDEYALCEELFIFVNDAYSESELEEKATTVWKESYELRKNLLSGMTTGVFSNELIELLFYAKENSTHIRHLIVASLVGSQFEQSKELIVRLVGGIGDYKDDPRRQEILEAFLVNVKERYTTE